MLGFDDLDTVASPLFPKNKSRSRAPLVSAIAISVAVAIVFFILGHSTAQAAHFNSDLALIAATPTPDPCPTKPFGQCAGLNFSAPADIKDLYNFSGTPLPLSCCPAGTSCVTFGPVWGMCMPAWGPASWAPTSAVVLDAAPTKVMVAASTPAQAAPAPATTPDPCPTKLFGQCAGLNFTAPKTTKDLYNFSGTPPPLSCCPAGSTCVTFGPVWGMCMPAWGAVASANT